MRRSEVLLVLLLMGARALAFEPDLKSDFSIKENDLALIIGGESKEDLFLPTLALAYKTFSEIGLPPDHIAVVAPSPFDMNGDGQSDEVFEPKPAALLTALLSLSVARQADSQLIVFVKSHGSNRAGEFEIELSSQNNLRLTAKELGTFIDLLGFAESRQLFVIDSCFSGLAGASLGGPNKWIATSTDSTHESWTHLASSLACIENPDEPEQRSIGYSLFSFDFLNALRPSDPLKIADQYDADCSGRLSLNEAFSFVKKRQQSLVLTIQNRPSTLDRMKLHFMGMEVSLTPDQSRCKAVLKNFPQLVRPQPSSDKN